jgi:hypothetical protein
MSIPLPVSELWRENTSGLSKLDSFVTEGAKIADDGQKRNVKNEMVKNVEHPILPSGVKNLI